MDKVLYTHKQQLGSGGDVSASLGINGENLRIELVGAYEHPIAKIIEPIYSVADGLVDKLEALIPGDQKAMATAAKADFRKAILDAIKSAVPSANLVEAPAEVEAPKAEPQV